MLVPSGSIVIKLGKLSFAIKLHKLQAGQFIAELIFLNLLIAFGDYLFQLNKRELIFPHDIYYKFLLNYY